MIETFKEFLFIDKALNQNGSIILENYFNTQNKFLSFMPDISLDLPAVEKQARIEDVSDFSNPITIRLADGSKLFFSSDEYRRLHKKPQVGLTMLVRFQRYNHDKSLVPSKITFCKIF
jgi:hypothetical protein